MRWSIALVCVASGCNQVFGLEPTVLVDGGIGGGDDVDLDGVPDEGDTCIAPAQDVMGDYDLDGVRNGDDPCPLDDTSMNAVDGDSDGLPDVCDPFPAVAGDTKRCFMKFSNSDLNLRLWRERGTTMEWALPSNELLTTRPTSTASLVATHELVGSDQPTLDVDLIVNGEASTLHGIQVWARAADSVLQSDVGCQLLGMPGYTQLAIILGGGGDVSQMTTFDNFPLGMPMRIRLTYSADADQPNVACGARTLTKSWTVKGMWELPAGMVGFGVDNSQVRITGLTIYDRAQRLPLP